MICRNNLEHNTQIFPTRKEIYYNSFNLPNKKFNLQKFNPNNPKINSLRLKKIMKKKYLHLLKKIHLNKPIILKSKNLLRLMKAELTN